MRLTFHQLKVFATLAQKLSITRTAEALHLTQPAVSIQLKQLEDYYAVKLVEIIGKKLYLTPAGHALAQAYHDIEARLSQVKAQLAQSKGLLVGKLPIAAVSTAKYFIPHLLGKFQQAYPHLEIQLKVTNRQTLIERLRNNQEELAIMSQLPDKLPLTAIPILDDELVMVAAPQHPLAKKRNILFKELQHEKLIWREEGSGTRMVMEKLFYHHRLKPPVFMELGSSETIKQAVMADMGISLLSKRSIEQELYLKRLIILKVKGLPWKHLWYVVYLKNKALPFIAQHFLEYLQKMK